MVSGSSKLWGFLLNDILLICDCHAKSIFWTITLTTTFDLFSTKDVLNPRLLINNSFM